MDFFKDHYATLGVPFGSSEERIKSAYRIRAFEWHPDLNHTPNAKKRMGEINEAYAVLSNPAGRASYDKLYPSFFGAGAKQARQRPLQQKPAVNNIDEILTEWAEGSVSLHEIVASMTFAEKNYAAERLHQAHLWMPHVKAYLQGQVSLEYFVQKVAKGDRKAAMLAMTVCVSRLFR